MCIFLPSITLVNINCERIEKAVEVLNFSSKHLQFKQKILFSDKIPKNITESITHIKIEKIDSIEKYNKFIIKDLVDYISTDFCLIVQNDGFITNPNLWKMEFLEYDYIGAPWNKDLINSLKRKNRIGNGGFSIRSKKLMSFIKKIQNIDFNQPEDVLTSVIVETHNFKTPSVEFAAEFSLENPIEDHLYNFHKTFGFHGHYIYDELNLASNFEYE